MTRGGKAAVPVERFVAACPCCSHHMSLTRRNAGPVPGQLRRKHRGIGRIAASRHARRGTVLDLLPFSNHPSTLLTMCAQVASKRASVAASTPTFPQIKALYDYTASADDEISFRAGEIGRLTDGSVSLKARPGITPPTQSDSFLFCLLNLSRMPTGIWASSTGTLARSPQTMCKRYKNL